MPWHYKLQSSCISSSEPGRDKLGLPVLASQGTYVLRARIASLYIFLQEKGSLCSLQEWQASTEGTVAHSLGHHHTLAVIVFRNVFATFRVRLSTSFPFPSFSSHPIPGRIPWTYSWLLSPYLCSHCYHSAWDAIPSPDHFAHQNSITAQVLVCLHSGAFPIALTQRNYSFLPYTSLSFFAFSWGPCFYYRLHLLILKTLLGDLYIRYICIPHLGTVLNCVTYNLSVNAYANSSEQVFPTFLFYSWENERSEKLGKLPKIPILAKDRCSLDPGSLRHKAWALNRWCCPHQS